MISAAILSFSISLLAPQGAVASTERHATEVGLGVLEDGGNAVDAAIAIHFALGVTYPNAGNLGGGGFLVYRSPSGENIFLDFREVAPINATLDMYAEEASSSVLGWLAVAVPGAVPGMWEAHQKYGSLPWSRLVSPAYELAKEGFVLSETFCQNLKRYQESLSLDSNSKKVFFDSQKIVAGTRFVQPELAQSLRLIIEQGVEAFREGYIVDEILRASKANKGVLCAEDFHNYRPQWRTPHCFYWQDKEIVTASLPSSGGLFLQQTLSILEAWPLSLWGKDDPRAVQLIGEASAVAFRDRNQFYGDPDSVSLDLKKLVDENYLQLLRQQVSSSSQSKSHEGVRYLSNESLETTHFSVLDSFGGAVSCTTTLNSNYGAKVMAAGILMNNEMDDFASMPGVPNQFGLVQSPANKIVPGRRPLSSMAPTIIIKDGIVDAVIGSPGGPTILTTVLQVILNRYVFKLSPLSSVGAPRFHRQDYPTYIRYEWARFSTNIKNRLSQFGQAVRQVKSLGLVNAIFRHNHAIHAVSDPRGDGAGAVLLD